jgi:pimeloyl-ACP methyl ester carboxylesterase
MRRLLFCDQIATAGGTAAMCATFLAIVTLSAQGQGIEALAGTWTGRLALPSASLRLVFEVSVSNGKVTATMDSPDQGARGIPVSSVTVENGKARFEVGTIRGVFEGILVEEGRKLEGIWIQGGARLPLSLSFGRESLNRPQEPQPPFPYLTKDLTFSNQKARISLAGTLTIPAGTGPFPALVLVTGSGPQNRDEELLGHKPFLVLADHLARHGIASLRYDDRGVGKSTGSFAAATTLDFADDAEAALEYLSSRLEVDPKRIGIGGHSEGGIVAAIVASHSERAAFAILLATPGLPGDELLLLQNEALAKAAGIPEAEIVFAKALNRALYDIAKSPLPPSELLAAAKKTYLEAIDGRSFPSAEERSATRDAADRVVAPLATPWTRGFLSLDPEPFMAALEIPVLALVGGRDLQVPPAENLAALRDSLGSAAGAAHPKSRIAEIPGLNHLFQHSDSGLPSEYGLLSETFSAEALEVISDWISGL